MSTMRIQLLSEADIARLHAASLRILAEVGVTIPHEETLSRLADCGATVDMERQHALLPSDLIERSLSKAGKKFTMYGRDTTKQAQFGEGQRNYNSIAGEASCVERPGAQRRYATLSDVATAARLGDALPRINLVGAMSDPHELPVGSRCVQVMAEMLRHTTKPITFWYHDRASARFLNEIQTAVRGSTYEAIRRPLCYPFLEPISPLRFSHNGVDLIYETSRLNLPVPIGPMAQMGLSAPCTLASTMAQENAEILAGICITQAIHPGTSVCYGGICHAFDMRTTQMIFAGPEQALFGVGMTELGKSYDLPVYINVGLTDSKRPDAQAGSEIAATLLPGAAAGADIFGHMGICGVDQASSLDMLVLQHEIIDYVESFLRDVTVDDASLALREIAAIDSSSGRTASHIATEHTAHRFRSELWFPKLMDRDYFDAWQERGAPSLEDRCVERKERLLRDHEPEPLPAELARDIDGIVAAARRELDPNPRHTA